MKKRTTVEIDEELLARARRALGRHTIRSTIEEALRRAAELSENTDAERAARQRRFLTSLAGWVDVEALVSEQMWR